VRFDRGGRQRIQPTSVLRAKTRSRLLATSALCAAEQPVDREQLHAREFRRVFVCVLRVGDRISRCMRLRAWIGSVVFAGFIAALALASAPELHARLHGTAADHECAATLIAAGSYEHSITPQIAAPIANPPIAHLIPLPTVAVTPLPLGCFILEHAPPAQP
jgi:hypothetical protein